jgi:2-methylisocitrate lyase-like PEP mutase family enzyme
MSPGFASLHAGPAPFVLPNAWDVASAAVLADAGFAAVGTTSLGVTAAAGLPDGAGAGKELTVALARAVVRVLTVPLTVDLEGGYSDDPAAVGRLVAELADIGVAGVNLEDGRADGTLRPTRAHARIVAAAAAAAPGVFVNARTDTFWLPGSGGPDPLSAAVERARAYADAGAAGIFVPGLWDLDGIGALAQEVRLPLNVLWRPGTDVAAMGRVGAVRISTGSALYRTALSAAVAAAVAARDGGSPPVAAMEYAAVQAAVGAR